MEKWLEPAPLFGLGILIALGIFFVWAMRMMRKNKRLQEIAGKRSKEYRGPNE